MQGRLKSIILQSSQEAWKVDFPVIANSAPHGEHGQPQEQQHQIPISAANITASTAAPPRNRSKRRADFASSSEEIQEGDDDDFMPPTNRNSCPRPSSSMARASIRKTFGASTSSKPPSIRCAPSTFRSLIEYLNMHQRRTINELGFGGLLDFYAHGLECPDLLIYLMDKLNPDSMIVEVGNECGLSITEYCVNKVLGLPNGDMEPPSSTEQECAICWILRSPFVWKKTRISSAGICCSL